MIITTKSEDYLKVKLDEYITQNNVQISPEDCEKFIKYLIQGEIKNLGGLTALRGFVYQYYVALYYMVEMLHSENTAWWTEVIFEYLDDITLHGNNQMRFVQVKTVRESGNHRITEKELYKRENGLNSWIDKLFLNVPDYKSKQLSIGHTSVQNINYQFEIATNSPENTTPLIYLENVDYNLALNKIADNENVYKFLVKEVVIKDIKNKKNTVTKRLESEIGVDIKEYLCRFHLKRLGSFDQLKLQIEKKISDIVKARGESQTHWVPQYIFKKLLSKVIDRTHQDHNLINKRDLLFLKSELIEWFDIWEQEALNIQYLDAINTNIQHKFGRCFDSLKRQFERDWKLPLRTELKNALGWLQNKLLEQNTVDSYHYNRFLNRLFELNNSNHPFSLDDIEDENFLKESIRYITFCMVFYPKRDLPYNTARLLFKQGQLKNGDKKIFAIFNARNQEEYKYAQDRIAVVISECSDSKSILEEYYCVITHNVPNQPINEFSSLMSSLVDTPSFEKSIITKPDNVKFVEQSKIDSFIESSKTLPKSFGNQAVQEIWHTNLETRV